MIETMRAADGAGLAATQVGVAERIAVIEVRDGNPRYPYKPPIPLTVIVNPELEPVDRRDLRHQRGLPLGAGPARRPRALRDVRVRYLDRHGEPHTRSSRGLTAGTFQHEVDHLDGVLFLDRMTDPSTLSTWEQFERYGKDEFVARIEALVARVGS